MICLMSYLTDFSLVYQKVLTSLMYYVGMCSFQTRTVSGLWIYPTAILRFFSINYYCII